MVYVCVLNKKEKRQKIKIKKKRKIEKKQQTKNKVIVNEYLKKC